MTAGHDPPVYDPSLQPAAAVLAVVPEDATLLGVTDWAQIRLQLGAGDLTSDSKQALRDAFWRKVERRSSALTPGMLRPDEVALASTYGFTQDDVDWEAHFRGPIGDGWVLKFRDDLDFDAVKEAVADGAGPFADAESYGTTHVASYGITTDPTASWQANPELTALVGQVANATYVARACLPFEVAFGPGLEGQLAEAPAGDVAMLDDLDAWSLAFGSELATVRLGPERPDVFDRARLADNLPQTDPDFGLGFAKSVADPVGGRIGYDMGKPAVAATLALKQHLPFAVCGE